MNRQGQTDRHEIWMDKDYKLKQKHLIHCSYCLFVFYIEKHQVILHELSFDERADLKAPDLLGPVFLAVQDDDESEDSFRNRQKLSQSIDDLCEMISEDENEEGIYCTYVKPRTIHWARRIKYIVSGTIYIIPHTSTK